MSDEKVFGMESDDLLFEKIEQDSAPKKETADDVINELMNNIENNKHPGREEYLKRLEQIPMGQLNEISTHHNDLDPDPVWIIFDGKKHKFETRTLQGKNSLRIKIETWNDCKGDKVLYNLLVRYNLARERTMFIDGNDLSKDEGLWGRLKEEIIDQYVEQLYGPAAVDTPEMEELAKNLVSGLLNSKVLSGNGTKENEIERKESTAPIQKSQT